MKPYEIVAQPFTVYVAPVGTAFPLIAAAPSGAWVKVGTSGPLNYMEAGVTVDHKQSHTAWHPLGGTGPRKVFITEEELHIKFQLADLTLEQYANALNYNTVTVVGTDTKKIGLSRGLALAQRSLLIRGGNSPYGDNWNTQYEIPVGVQIAEASVVFVKGVPAHLSLEWLVIEDPNAASIDERFGRLLCEIA